MAPGISLYRFPMIPCVLRRSSLIPSTFFGALNLCAGRSDCPGAFSHSFFLATANFSARSQSSGRSRKSICYGGECFVLCMWRALPPPAYSDEFKHSIAGSEACRTHCSCHELKMKQCRVGRWHAFYDLDILRTTWRPQP